jgi:predicted nucleic acid-binding protein/ribosomal protein S18 acetylase RimI-like enzyme
MIILEIESNSRLLVQIKKLYRANSRTLGFFPDGAFQDYASSKRIIAAVESDENVLGYLLYRINVKNRVAFIHHLCVDQSARNKGVCKALFNSLVNLIKSDVFEIRAHCRRDYEASKVWPKLGFVAQGEQKGKSEQGSILTNWLYDFGYHSLFDFDKSRSKAIAAIDANIFFDIIDPSEDAKSDSKILTSGWVEDSFEIVLTQEIFNEIDRCSDLSKRNRSRSLAKGFKILKADNVKFEAVASKLRKHFSLKLTVNDESDFRHLCHAIYERATFFVTHDPGLLKMSDDIFEDFGIRILAPSHFIIKLDSYIRESEYCPDRLSGYQLKFKRIASEDIQFIDLFRDSRHETKSEFTRLIDKYLADPHNYISELLLNGNNPLALYIHISYNNLHDVPILRVLNSSLSPTIARFLTFYIINAEKDNDLAFIKISDANCSDQVLEALSEFGFMNTSGGWVKANLPFVGGSIKLVSYCKENAHLFSNQGISINDIITRIDTASADKKRNELLKIEEILFPAKFDDIDMPAFIVPIQPRWAMHLFDFDLAKNNLFGGDLQLLLKSENAYYRSNRPNIIRSPARLLWYVSKGAENSGSGKCIKACSYLADHSIGTPKELFSRFKRLGVFRYSDLLRIAENNQKKEISAIQFSYTEMFTNPITYEEIQRIIAAEMGKRFHIQSPIEIPAKLFYEFYKKGMKWEG